MQKVLRQKTTIHKIGIKFNRNLHHIWSNGLVVKALDSQSRGPVLKTTRWFQGRLSLSSFQGRYEYEYQEFLETYW